MIATGPLIAALPQALAHGAPLKRVQALASRLPPMRRGGFEVRLGGSDQVDLQWCIRREESELAELRDWLTGREGEAWLRLASFVRDWSDPDTVLHQVVGEIWLEFDLDATGDHIADPAVFIRLPHDPDRRDEALATAFSALDRLLPTAEADARRAPVERSFRACRGPEFIGYVGVMVSRPGVPLRLNAKRVEPDRLAAWLADAGWEGDTDGLETTYAALRSTSEKLVLCCDVGETFQPRLAVECRPSSAEDFASNLVAQGHATAGTASALQQWTEQQSVSPPSSAVPADPVARAQLGMAPLSDRLGRAISHFKVPLGPGAGEAKAYLWFEHAIARQAGDVDALPSCRVSVGSYYSNASPVEWAPAIGSGLHYHFGLFTGDEPLEAGLERTVRDVYPHVPRGARMLDLGCGWGGPAAMFAAERDCSVTGVTASAVQAAHCRSRGLDVHQLDLEDDWIPGSEVYDIAFALESIEHMHDKAGVLRRARQSARRLIVTANVSADGLGRYDTYSGTMRLCTVSDLVELVTEAGWTIRSIRNRRFQSLRTLTLWRDNIEAHWPAGDPPAAIRDLLDLCRHGLADPLHWARNNPLIDIVAD
ncbi:MAG: class I SAM-dependent methyltransferase [Brevundimonas sp.]|uniref:class I SAM-dependent methyltransferase n=1 Tax=Brevundimonas sp. TaxID=1871086 RepID=UPI002732B612|nr:class I SAM-dependent methyltransferase [Brevundimonas sp.]MDP3379649.1 class I SAM-dependent methyltransferase [Brevundimonas sp.]